jgi:hypothetical protein
LKRSDKRRRRRRRRANEARIKTALYTQTTKRVDSQEEEDQNHTEKREEK